MKKIILEVLVDKRNEKGPWVFEYILIVLHKVFDDLQNDSIFDKIIGKDNISSQVAFSLEISKIWNRIRFFIVSPHKYKNFLINQIYAHYNDVEIHEVWDYLEKIPNDKLFIWKLKLKKHHFYSIKSFTEIQEEWSNETIDPYSSITSALGRSWKYTLNSFQINFTPVSDKSWKKDATKIIEIITSKSSNFRKKLLMSKWYFLVKLAILPFSLVLKFFLLIFRKDTSDTEIKLPNDSLDSKTNYEETTLDGKSISIPKNFINKLSLSWYKTSINLIHAWEDPVEARWSIKEIISTLWIYSSYWQNSLVFAGFSNNEETINEIKKRIIWKQNFVLSTNELSWLVHLPTTYVKTPQINWVSARNFEPPSDLPIIDPDLTDDIVPETNLTPLWKTNFRWTDMSFGIWPDDRRRHIYVIWKTWMGKSTLLENMIIDDIRKDRWVAVIDPHGDLAEAVIWFIPKSRTNQTIIFDPSDTNWPIAFNMLDNISPELRPLVASGLVWIFKKIFWDSWWPRLEHILRNTILALLEYPNTTLISIPLMLTSDVYRWKVVNKITDRVVKNFWIQEFWKMAPNQKTEATAPILNKVWQFLSSTILRNVLWQPKNSFDVRWAMDNKKIIIINLSKWKIWEDASALLWAMMVTKFQMDAMSRADIPEDKREDFYLYVDEFQNFATDSFATILSEARKYKLNLVMANQYIDQMSEEVSWAVFWNVWSLVAFQTGYNDSRILKEVFAWDINEEDLMNLKKYNIYLKQLIDGMPSPIFSASTFAPNSKNNEIFHARYKKILNVSREKYSKSKKSVEDKINKTLEDIEGQEKVWEKKKEEFKNKKATEKKIKHEEMMKKQDEERKKREEVK